LNEFSVVLEWSKRVASEPLNEVTMYGVGLGVGAGALGDGLGEGIDTVDARAAGVLRVSVASRSSEGLNMTGLYAKSNAMRYELDHDRA